MKFYSLIFLIGGVVSVSYSQIPNYSFENWVDMGGYSEPEGWSNLNSVSAPAGIVTCESGSPGNPGTSYLKLTSKSVPGAGIMPGIAISGEMDVVSMEPISGFAFSERPEELTGKWQHMIFGTSQGFVDVQLTRWDAATSSRIVVASAHKTLTGMAMSWATFSIPLTYLEDNYPDSCVITLAASGATPAANDYLYIDNLAFEGEAVISGIQQSMQNEFVRIAPNPVNETATVYFQDLLQAESLMVYAATGQLMYKYDIWNMPELKLDVSTFEPGIYTITAISQYGKGSQLLVVK